MGFLDKAKAAAMDLQQKADTAMSNLSLIHISEPPRPYSILNAVFSLKQNTTTSTH